MNLKPISNFPGYSVSDLGWIESDYRFITRNLRGTIHSKEVKRRILKTGLNGNKYHFVTLRKNNRPYAKNVHVLVAQEFIGPRPKGLVIHHKDNDKNNNAVSNLEYVTRQKNTQEFFKSIGKRKGFININDLPTIFNRIESGESLYVIADEYNITRNDIATISRVIKLKPEQS